MTHLIQSYLDNYVEWQEKHRDTIADGYPLMDAPFATIGILVLYFAAIRIGPQLMKEKPAFSLATYNRLYNFAQLIFCAGIVFRIYSLTETKPNGVYLLCKKYDKTAPENREMAVLAYVNFIVRIVELSESFVHILRKKNRQLSRLHVSHHTMNVLLAWITVKFNAGGSSSTIIMLNFSVHFVMFAYYWASMQKGTVQQLANKFKKYITMIQLAQFFVMFAIIGLSMTLERCRGNSAFILYPCIAVLSLNTIMFINFYINSYLKQKPKSS